MIPSGSVVGRRVSGGGVWGEQAGVVGKGTTTDNRGLGIEGRLRPLHLLLFSSYNSSFLFRLLPHSRIPSPLCFVVPDFVLRPDTLQATLFRLLLYLPSPLGPLSTLASLGSCPHTSRKENLFPPCLPRVRLGLLPYFRFARRFPEL